MNHDVERKGTRRIAFILGIGLVAALVLPLWGYGAVAALPSEDLGDIVLWATIAAVYKGIAILVAILAALSNERRRTLCLRIAAGLTLVAGVLGLLATPLRYLRASMQETSAGFCCGWSGFTTTVDPKIVGDAFTRYTHLSLVDDLVMCGVAVYVMIALGSRRDREDRRAGQRRHVTITHTFNSAAEE